jgi:hypothetical protein
LPIPLPPLPDRAPGVSAWGGRRRWGSSESAVTTVGGGAVGARAHHAGPVHCGVGTMVHGHCSSERDGGAQASCWHGGLGLPGARRCGDQWGSLRSAPTAVWRSKGCRGRPQTIAEELQSCYAGAGGSGLLVLGTSDDATCGAPGGWIFFLFFRKCPSSAKAQTLGESLKKMLYVRQSAKLHQVPDVWHFRAFFSSPSLWLPSACCRLQHSANKTLSVL